MYWGNPTQGTQRGDFLDAVSAITIRRYFYSVVCSRTVCILLTVCTSVNKFQSVQVVCKYRLIVTAAFYCFPEVAALSSL